MASESNITQEDGGDNNNNKERKTRSEVYQHFSYNEKSLRWDCKFCR
jgi:hypothetical protein